MSRNISSQIIAATTAPTVSPVVFVEADFASGFLRVHSGYGNLVLNGNTFLGTGNLGKISQVEESSDMAQGGVTFELSGIPSTSIALFLGEHYQGRPIKAWLALIDSAGVVQPGAYEFFTGRMDTSAISEGPESSAISISAESEVSDLRRSRERRFTHEDRRRIYPNERGFEYVTAMQNRTIMWGKIYRSGESGYMAPWRVTAMNLAAYEGRTASDNAAMVNRTF